MSSKQPACAAYEGTDVRHQHGDRWKRNACGCLVRVDNRGNANDYLKLGSPKKRKITRTQSRPDVPLSSVQPLGCTPRATPVQYFGSTNHHEVHERS